jgi:hypothetical protein
MSIRRSRYLCPYCQRNQMLFSLLPTRKNTWDCTKCHKTFELSVRAIADNWANTIALWSLPPWTVLVIIFMVMAASPGKKVWAVLCSPVFSVPLAVVVYVLCIPAGLLAGSIISRQPTQRRCKMVIHVVD